MAPTHGESACKSDPTTKSSKSTNRIELEPPSGLPTGLAKQTGPLFAITHHDHEAPPPAQEQTDDAIFLDDR